MQLRQRRSKATPTATGYVATAATAATATANLAAAAFDAAVQSRARGNRGPTRQQFALTPY